jgi:hypothetical protein
VILELFRLRGQEAKKKSVARSKMDAELLATHDTRVKKNSSLGPSKGNKSG